VSDPTCEAWGAVYPLLEAHAAARGITVAELAWEAVGVHVALYGRNGNGPGVGPLADLPIAPGDLALIGWFILAGGPDARKGPGR
jgi:hypothetical protein